MISRRLALAGLAAALLPAAALAHPHEELTLERLADLERQVTTFRTALKDAVQTRDLATLRAMYAASFAHTDEDGRVERRAARVAALLAGQPAIETAPASEIAVRLFGPDTAMVAGRSAVGGAELRWLQAMTRSAGHWQLAASQATRLAPAA
jgi:hypothetical protein